MDDQPAQELGLEPRRLRGHYATGVGNGKDCFDPDRLHGKCEHIFPSVHKPFEVGNRPRPSEILEACIPAGIGDAEHPLKDVFLEDGHVQEIKKCRPFLQRAGALVPPAGQGTCA